MIKDPIERELAMFRKLAHAPRPMRLGCAKVTHDRLTYCAACTGDWSLECNGWRLLALREDAQNGGVPTTT